MHLYSSILPALPQLAQTTPKSTSKAYEFGGSSIMRNGVQIRISLWHEKWRCAAPWLHLRSAQVAQRTRVPSKEPGRINVWQRMAAFQSEAFYAPNINPELHSLPLSFVVFLWLFPSIYFFRWHEARRLWHSSSIKKATSLDPKYGFWRFKLVFSEDQSKRGVSLVRDRILPARS